MSSDQGRGDRAGRGRSAGLTPRLGPQSSEEDGGLGQRRPPGSQHPRPADRRGLLQGLTRERRLRVSPTPPPPSSRRCSRLSLQPLPTASAALRCLHSAGLPQQPLPELADQAPRRPRGTDRPRPGAHREDADRPPPPPRRRAHVGGRACRAPRATLMGERRCRGARRGGAVPGPRRASLSTARGAPPLLVALLLLVSLLLLLLHYLRVPAESAARLTPVPGWARGAVLPALTSACGRRPRARRRAVCPCPNRSASSGSSAAPARVGSRLHGAALSSARVPGPGKGPAPPAHPQPRGNRTRRRPRPGPAPLSLPPPPPGGTAPLPARPALTGHGAAPSRPPLRRHVPHCPPFAPPPQRSLRERRSQSPRRARPPPPSHWRAVTARPRLIGRGLRPPFRRRGR